MRSARAPSPAPKTYAIAPPPTESRHPRHPPIPRALPVDLKNYVEGFVASATFDGTRPGMVFKRGDTGVGYYPDLAAPKADAGVASLTAQVAELMPAASAPATSID